MLLVCVIAIGAQSQPTEQVLSEQTTQKLLEALAQQTELLTKDDGEHIGWRVGNGQFHDCKSDTDISIGNGKVKRTQEQCPGTPPLGAADRVPVLVGTVMKADIVTQTVQVKVGASQYALFLPKQVGERDKVEINTLRPGATIKFASIISGRIDAVAVGNDAILKLEKPTATPDPPEGVAPTTTSKGAKKRRP